MIDWIFLVNDLFQVSLSTDSTVTNCASETKPQSEMMPAEIKEEELTPNEAKEENNASLVNLVLLLKAPLSRNL